MILLLDYITLYLIVSVDVAMNINIALLVSDLDRNLKIKLQEKQYQTF